MKKEAGVISKIFGASNGNVTVMIGVGLLIAVFVFYVGRRIYVSHKYRYKELRALGFFQEKIKEIENPNTKGLRQQIVKRKIKVAWHGTKLIFSKYNLAYSPKDFERLKDKLEHVFGIKIEDITAKKSFFWWQQSKIVLHTKFPQVFMEDCPKDLALGEMWLGLDVTLKAITLDTIGKFQFVLGIFSQTGGGKGNLISGAVKSLLGTWIKKTGSHPYNFLILDAKGTDYFRILEEFNGKTLNPIHFDELTEAVETLKAYVDEVNNYRRYLSENRVSVSHWFQIKDRFPQLKPIPRPLLLLCDETTQYLQPRPSIKITKESTEAQKQLKAKYDLEEELAFLVNTILQLFRSSGVVVIVATQASREGDLNLDRTNIKNLCIGQQNSVMSRALTGSDIAEDSTLVRGRFIFSGDGQVARIQSPWVLDVPKKSAGKKS